MPWQWPRSAYVFIITYVYKGIYLSFCELRRPLLTISRLHRLYVLRLPLSCTVCRFSIDTLWGLNSFSGESSIYSCEQCVGCLNRTLSLNRNSRGKTKGPRLGRLHRFFCTFVTKNNKRHIRDSTECDEPFDTS